MLREQEAGLNVAEVCRKKEESLEGEVRRHERLGCEATEAARGREREDEEIIRPPPSIE